MARKILPFIMSIVIALGLMSAVAWAAPEVGTTQRGVAAPHLQATITPTVTATPPVSSTTNVTPTAPGQANIAETIADVFGVTMADVMAIRKTTGWGNVYRIFRLAQMTDMRPDEIAEMRETKGWGPIYKELGVRPGKGDNLGQAKKNGDSSSMASTNRSQDDDDKDKGKPDDKEHGKPDDKGKGNSNGNGKSK